MKNYLVTGANGFIGSAIVKEVVKRGDSATIIDTDISQTIKHKNIRLIQGSILDRYIIKEAIKNIDSVFHCAALTPLRKSGAIFWSVNVQGTKNILEAAKESNVKSFCHLSTSAIFGNVDKDDCPVRGTPKHLRPIEAYGKSKKIAEELVQNESDKSKTINYSIIRPRTVVGPYRLGIFQVLFEWISENKNIYIIGDGSNHIQFIHINDLVQLCLNCISKNITGTLNAGSEDVPSIKSSLESLCHYANSSSKIIPLPIAPSILGLKLLDKLGLSPLAPWHYLTYHKNFYFDIEEEKKIADWKPKYSNDQALQDSYLWYLNNKNSLTKATKGKNHKSIIQQQALKILKLIS